MKKINNIIRDTMSRRQVENYERFVQERAGAFQVTGQKERAMVWVLSPMAR